MTVRSRLHSELSLNVTKRGRVALSVAAAESAGLDGEELTVTAEATGCTLDARVVVFRHGTRVHVVDLPEGEVTVRYRAERPCPPAEAEALTDADLILYTRPSRYCPSDRVGGFAHGEFGELPGARAQVEAIVRYVGTRIAYVGGSSRPTDDAVDTLLAGDGVCRDYAHLCVTLCRVLDIPARFVAVYAPGLSPMDFHAVFEAAIDGRWQLFDASRLAPRQSMTRIATGRDAADTAFLSTLGSELDLRRTSVTATIDPELPTDDGTAQVALA
ncbi:transglutaminase-like domain-containing protein [Qaidamihabitans albus]|uniref:transglutaminase-like domain-containing protein n=1 Tax=Qaidamihabitans albus TaxID=2795733 RepID=UPI0018F1CD5B|nr:transglutaminase family protein [Qaidamihabitans albus]